MIFVTVGTQFPFDRLVRAVDEWSGRSGIHDIFAQIGPSAYRPSHFPSAEFTSPLEFEQRVRAAELIVAHAGMGSILLSLEHAKPLVVMPRRADLGEHRNDHQLATARHFRSLRQVAVADDPRELADLLDRRASLGTGTPITPTASDSLIEAVRAMIDA